VKARPGILLLLGIALLVVVPKLLPKGGGSGPARGGRSVDAIGEEERPSSRSRRGAVRSFEPPAVALDRLEAPPAGEAFAIGRNLFRYGAPKPPQPPPGVPGGAPGGKPGVWRPGGGAAPPAVDQPLTPPPPVVPAAPPKPQPPPVTVRYLGAFGPKGHTVAVFTDGGEIYDVFEGETFASRYVLRRINLETVELGFVGFPDDQIEKLEVGP
jgi:hypothetical protein